MWSFMTPLWNCSGPFIFDRPSKTLCYSRFLVLVLEDCWSTDDPGYRGRRNNPENALRKSSLLKIPKVEKYLNSGKYRPNDKDFFGWTALHAACAGLHFYVIKILLEHDEDPTCTDRRGNSAIQLMILWNRIGKDIYQSYRDTLRLMIKKARELYGKNVINKEIIWKYYCCNAYLYFDWSKISKY